MRVRPISVVFSLATVTAVLACSAANGTGDDEVQDDNDGGPAGPKVVTVRDAMPDTMMDARSGVPTVPVRIDAGMSQDATIDSEEPDSGPDDADVDDATSDVKDAAVPMDTDDAATGSTCPMWGKTEERPCGVCGVQTRLCAPKDEPAGFMMDAPPKDAGKDASKDGGAKDAGPGHDAGPPSDAGHGDGGHHGPLVWQEWGFCQHEVHNGCVPGTSGMAYCGHCGTQSTICQNDCRPQPTGRCMGQPENSCEPGSLDWRGGLSCTAGGRLFTCEAACTWSEPSDCLASAPQSIEISPNYGHTLTAALSLDENHTIGALDPNQSCHDDNSSEERTTRTPHVLSTVTPYLYVTLTNPSDKTAVLSLWTSAPDDDLTSLDLLIATYDGIPASNDDRGHCVDGVAGGSDGIKASDEDDTGVKIAPHGSLVVYVGVKAPVTHLPTGPVAGGNFILDVKTEWFE
jgi:hypothetical protein